MAQYSSFFRSVAGDRKYSADQFAEYFRSFLTNGIFNGGTNLQVTVNDMKSTIDIGKGWIEGYYYHNKTPLELTHSSADTVNDRIDRVVIRLDLNEGFRSVKAYIKTGTPSATPEAPELVRELEAGTVLQYELSLAQMLVKANATEIESADVTDERLDNELCGLVNSLIQADTTDIFNQFQAFLNGTIDEWDAYFLEVQGIWDTWFGDTNVAWNNWFTATQNDYQAWYDGIKATIFDAVYFQFENWRYRAGHTYKTLFDTPTSGDITEEIRNTTSDALVASKVTEFDTPAAGQIQETLSIVEGAITVRKITTFNVDGSIDEAITEVI